MAIFYRLYGRFYINIIEADGSKSFMRVHDLQDAIAMCAANNWELV